MQLEKPDFEAYQQAFHLVDKDGSGTIDEQELLDAMKYLQIDIDLGSIQAVMSIVDDDNNKQLEFDEFARLCYICENAHSQDVKTILFLAADKDYSGNINCDELKQILKKMELELEDVDVEQIYNEIVQESNSTEMCYDDFIKLMEIIFQQ